MKVLIMLTNGTKVIKEATTLTQALKQVEAEQGYPVICYRIVA